MQRLKEDSNALNRTQATSNRKNNPKMYSYGRELCFVLAIIFTSYAALQNAPPKVSKSPPAVPFFSPNSFIADSFRGDLATPFERFSESEASFVMYYAPWDAECQEMRTAIHTVAQYYYKQVYFAAINCWQPQSECKLQFSNIQQYPVIILYIQHSKGIQYNGIKDANNLIRFIKNAINPLHRIHSWDDLFKLLAEYDALVVGYFDFQEKNNSSIYQIFYNTALKFLEKDPNNEVAFGVVTNSKVAKNLGIYKIPTIQLYLWNESISYHGEATEDSICHWITQNIHQVTVWISPPGVKSLTLSPYVEDGPVLIMFTPRNPFAINLNYDLLKEVGLDYYNCDNHLWVDKLISYVIKNRQDKKQKFIKDLQICHNNIYEKTKIKTDEVIPIALPPIESSRWANVSYHEICQTCNEICKSQNQQKVENRRILKKISENCGFIKRESSQKNIKDIRSPEQLNIIMRNNKCREIQKALQISSNSAQNIIKGPKLNKDNSSPENFKGFACQTNQTLALLAIDSLKFHQFAEGLGIDVTKYPDQTSVIIFNAQDESAFILNGPFNKYNLQSFIFNYTKGLLPRSAPRRSRSRAFLNIYQTHSAYSECNLESEYACIPELDAPTFLEALESQRQDLVVFFHTDHCAFCHGVTAHAFLMLARYFRHASDFIQFARLDGEAHDLPWQFTMDRYPAVVYFPGDNKESESRLFPRDRPFSLSNLISFVMSNLVPEERCLTVISSLCAIWFEPEFSDSKIKVNEKGFIEIGQRCLSCARRAYLHRISDILARYRRLSYTNLIQYNLITRREILLTLQHLRESYFLLETGNGDAKYFRKIRQSYKNYAQAIRALKTVSNIDNKSLNSSRIQF